MNRTVRALCVISASALFAACTPTGLYFGALNIPKNQVLFATNGSEPRSLDPHKTAGVPEANIMLNLYDCLTTYDPETAAPIPALAETWEPNADASVWTFHLRRGATWTDGTPLTAHDFVWSWRRIADDETASPYASLIYYVKNGQAINEGMSRFRDRATGAFRTDAATGHELAASKDEIEKDAKLSGLAAQSDLVPYEPEDLGVRAIDDYTLEVTMQQPTAFFISMTPHYAFTAVPRQAIEKFGDQWVLPENHVSSGPFRLVERIQYDRIVLEKWDGHWDAARVMLKRVVLYPIEDLNTVVNLYKSGEVQVTWGSGQSIPVTFVKALRTKKDFTADPQYSTYYYSLNVNKPPMDNPKVRHALNMAVNKELICEKIMQAGQLPATTFVAPGTPGYPYPRGDDYNPEKARQLLAEAGYPGGKDFPAIEIAFNTNETHRQVAEAVQSMWKTELGITVNLTNMEWQAFQAFREKREYKGASRDGWVADYLDPNTFLDLMVADTLNNHSGWVDKKYTELLMRANREVDPQIRLNMLAEAEQMMLDAQPIIPIYFYSGVKLIKPFVRGWHDNALDQHPLKFVSIDEAWREGTEIAQH
jgi:oligopeptide transport system substrate-binding protein